MICIYIPKHLLSGPDILPMLPGEPSSSLVEYQYKQIHCKGCAHALGRLPVNKLLFPENFPENNPVLYIMPYYRNKTNKVLLIMAPGGNGCNADDAEENWI